MIVRGTIEVLTEHEQGSEGLPVQAATTASVPVIIEAVYGYREVEPVSSPREGAIGEWTARTPLNADAVVLLWEEAPVPGPFPQPED